LVIRLPTPFAREGARWNVAKKFPRAPDFVNGFTLAVRNAFFVMMGAGAFIAEPQMAVN